MYLPLFFFPYRFVDSVRYMLNKNGEYSFVWSAVVAIILSPLIVFWILYLIFYFIGNMISARLHQRQ